MMEQERQGDEPTLVVFHTNGAHHNQPNAPVKPRRALIDKNYAGNQPTKDPAKSTEENEVSILRVERKH